MARQLLWWPAMEPIETIEPRALATVHGGFGAILTALISQAPAIISAFKGGGGGAQTASAQPQVQPPTAQPLPQPPGGPVAPTQMASAPATSACRCACDPIGAASVQNNVRIG
jgi:hypothetical protein